MVIESWRAQYPAFLYPGQQTIDAPEGEPFPATPRAARLAPPGRLGGLRARGCASADLVVLAVLSPVQVPAYLGILYGLGAPGQDRSAPVPQRAAARAQAVRRAADEGAARRVDGVLAHSGEQAALARGLTGAPVQRRRAAAAPAGARPRARWRGREVHGRLLFFGIVRPYKGLDVLLRRSAEVGESG